MPRTLLHNGYRLDPAQGTATMHMWTVMWDRRGPGADAGYLQRRGCHSRSGSRTRDLPATIPEPRPVSHRTGLGTSHYGHMWYMPLLIFRICLVLGKRWCDVTGYRTGRRCNRLRALCTLYARFQLETSPNLPYSRSTHQS